MGITKLRSSSRGILLLKMQTMHLEGRTANISPCERYEGLFSAKGDQDHFLVISVIYVHAKIMRAFITSCSAL